MLKTKKNFCARPFVLCNITPNGNFSPCCRIPEGFGNVKNQNLETLWNSETMVQLRKTILNDGRSTLCSDCWNIEDRGLISERLSSGNLSLSADYQEKILRDYGDGIVPTFEALEIRPSNLCNFTCRMCHPTVSSAWHPLNISTKLHSDVSPKVIKAYPNTTQMMNDLQPFLSSIKAVKIHGGEPMFEPQVTELLRLFQPYKDQIWLRWITNLSIIDHPFYQTDLLKGWKRLSTTVSLDGPPAVSEYIRRGQNIINFERNLVKLKDLNTDIFFHISLQALNVLRIPEFIDYAIGLGPYRVTCNKVTFPNSLNTHVLPIPIKQSALQRLQAFEKEFLKIETSERLREDLLVVIHEGKKLLSEESPPNASRLWKDFLNWNYAIDKSSETLLGIYPEFEPYLVEVESYANL